MDLDLPQEIPADCNLRMTDDSGADVLSQKLSNGKIAVRASLPAGASKTWNLYSGKPSLVLSSGLVLQDLGNYFEITNGMTGVRVTKIPGGGANPLAPIQGIRYRDGSWTATAANYLTNPAPNWFNYNQTFVSMSATVVESGPLKSVIKVNYVFNKSELNLNNGSIYWPPGMGNYSSTIEVQAFHPSVLVEDESDALMLYYTVNGYAGNSPNQARYRAHHASSPQFGYSPDGTIYRGVSNRWEYDAQMDLQYNSPMLYASYDTFPGQAYKRVNSWDMWTYDSGWYNMIYNKDAGANGNIFGWFLGKASRSLGTQVGFGMVTGPGGIAGVQVQLNGGSASAPFATHNRFHWGIFVGTKGQDITSITPCPSYDNQSGWCQATQTITKEMNLHGGVNLNKIYRWKLDYDDPVGGYKSLYFEDSAYQNLVSRVRSDSAYYTDLYNNRAVESRGYLDLWRNPVGQPLTASYNSTLALAKDLLDSYVNGNGIFTSRYGYWMGGVQMNNTGLVVHELLKLGYVSPAQKTVLKAANAFFGNVLWDNDIVPLDNAVEAGINMGTPNMPVQHVGFRDFMALTMSEHPEMKPRIPGVLERVQRMINTTVNEAGSHMSSPGYAGIFETVLNTAQQLKMNGTANLFASNDRIAKFSEFYMNLMTPPDVRFGDGLRRLLCIGDAQAQTTALYGQLATGLWDVNPNLSARLMGAWKSMGSFHNAFFNTTLLKINEQLPASNPQLGSAHFDDYISVLRNGWGTPNESSLFFIDGSYLKDHRHNDQGSFVLYSLGAPLSIDWGSQYYPQVAGAYQHNTVLLESALGQPWNQDHPALNLGGYFGDPATPMAFESFSLSASAKGIFKNDWTRTVTSIHPNENTPIFLIQDDFTSATDGQAKIVTLNLMAAGPVTTSVGTVQPTLRTDPELPSSGSVYNMAAGLNRMLFQGQWLIDWDLYSLNNSGQQFLIGNWANRWTNGYNANRFQKANGVPYEERQHILRIRGNGPFRTLIMPFKKGMRPADRSVTQQGDLTVITEGGATTRVGKSFYSYQNSTMQALTTFDATAVSDAGIQASGGPVEIVVRANSIQITVHGAPGVRNLVLPRVGSYSIDYKGGAPQMVQL